MANKLRTDVFRPEICPDGHVGRVWLNGPYSEWSDPKGGQRHKFTLTLPPRHPTEDHPHTGDTCGNCERAYLEGEEPACGHEFMFTIREKAHSLILVSQGHSLRETGEQIRVEALRPKQAPRPKQRLAAPKVPRRKTAMSTSKEMNIVADTIDVFAPLVLADLRDSGKLATSWPRSVVIDSTSLRTRLWQDGVAHTGGRDAGELYVAMGTNLPNGEPIPLAVGLFGSKDHLSVLDFFATLSGEPEWVVTDDDAALAKAIAIAWPNAVHYLCEGHLLRLAEAAFRADHLDLLPEAGALLSAVREAQWTNSRFDELKNLVAALPTGAGQNLSGWVAMYESVVRGQIALRKLHPGMTRSQGSVESLITWIEKKTETRHVGWRNLARVNSVLTLMIAHKASILNEDHIVHVMSRHLQANGGATGLKTSADYKRFRDRVGDSSLRRLIDFAGVRGKAAQRQRSNSTVTPNRKRRIGAKNVKLAAAGLAPIAAANHHKRTDGSMHSVYRSAKGKFVSDFPDLMAEWHKTANGTLNPKKVRGTYPDQVWWQCAVGHEWRGTVLSRATRRTRCPYCTNRKVDSSNSLAALRPDLAAEWDLEKNELKPEQVTPGADRDVNWKCATCGHRWQAKVYARALMDTGCPQWLETPHEGRPGNRKFERNRPPKATQPTEAHKADPDLPF